MTNPYCKTSYNNNDGVGASTESSTDIDVNTGDIKTWGMSSCEYKGDWNFKGTDGPTCSKKWDEEFKRAGKALGIDWVLVAAISSIESGWKEDVENHTSTAGGLYQFIAKYWRGDAPKGYEDAKYRLNGKIATDAFINRMKRLMTKFQNATSRNDQILLCFQSWHDGVISGTSWKNFKGNKYSGTQESRNYIPKIMKRYKELGGTIS